MSPMPWCIIGDFNDMMFGYEKQGGQAQPRRLLEGFTEAVNDSGLMDLGYKGSEFTWERSRGSIDWVKERLDRGLANNDWKRMFPLAEVQVMEVSTSDHMPLILQLKRMVYVPKRKRFRFENMWIQETDCYNIIRDSWNIENARSIVEKMQYCSMKLEEWGGGKVKEMQIKMKKCRGDMRKYRSRRDSDGVQRYNKSRDEFLKLLEQKEVFWKQRAKQYWLREGDQNTRFFHTYASGRKRNNQLRGLMDKHDEWKENEEDIQGIIVDYFTELFKRSEEVEGLTDQERVKQVTEEQNEMLGEKITEEEVKVAVFSMYPE